MRGSKRNQQISKALKTNVDKIVLNVTYENFPFFI